MYAINRTASGVADAEALSNSLKTLPVEAAFVQVNNYLLLHREQAKDFFRVCFPVLLQRIFGFEDHPTAGSIPTPAASSAGGWLQQASSPGKELEARSLLANLAPNATLFQTLLSMDRSTPVRFVFPSARLPDWVRRLLVSSQGVQLLCEQAPIFQGHVVKDAMDRFQVHLDLFHYYFFWYAYYVVCKDTAASRSTRVAQAAATHSHFPTRRLDPWPSLKLPGLPSPTAAPAAPYRDLLRRYLHTFLPYSAPAMLAPPPPTNIMRQLSRTPSKIPDGRSPQHLNRTPSKIPDARTPQVLAERVTPLDRGDIILHTLLTFWLRDGDPTPFSAANGSPYGGMAPYAHPPAGEDLIHCLQILVSHIDGNPQLAALQGDPSGASRGIPRPTFERGGSLSSGFLRSPVPGGSQPSLSSPPLPLASQALQRPLYRLLLRALLHWPLQNGGLSKVEKLVDVWVGHLQPWGGAQQQANQPPRQAEGKQQPTPAYSAKWSGYVVAHYLFYNSLVVHLVEWGFRASQTDSSATGRVIAKVLGALQSPALLELLRKVEAAYVGHVAARHAPGHQSDLCTTLEEQLREWENGLVQPTPVLGGIMPASQAPRLRLFAAEDTGGPRLLQGLVHRLQAEASRGAAQAQSVKQLTTLAGALMAAAGQEKGRGEAQENKKQPQERREAPAGGEPADGTERPKESNQNARPSMPGLQRHTWADAHYKGDWMRRPLESGEIGWLVRALVRLSDYLNDVLQLGPQAEARNTEQGGAERKSDGGEEPGSSGRGEEKGPGRAEGSDQGSAPRQSGGGKRGNDKGSDRAEGSDRGSAPGQNGEGDAQRRGGNGTGTSVDERQTNCAGGAKDEGLGSGDAVPLPVLAAKVWGQVCVWAKKGGRHAAEQLHQEALKRHWRVNLRPLGEVQTLVVISLCAVLLWLLRLLIHLCFG